MPSLSEHLNDQVDVLLNADFSGREEKAKELCQYLQEPADAYFRLQGDVHVAHMPALSDWNLNFRKAYTILFWMRVNIEEIADEDPVEISEKNVQSEASEREDDGLKRRILYRFCTSGDDSNGSGVCVSCSQWKCINEIEVQTTLTAYALPYNNPSKLSKGGFLRAGGHSTPYASWTQQTITLNQGQWHLVACTHIHPYLKHPMWSVAVDGALVNGATELHYPVLSEHKGMEFCSLLQNMTASGALKVLDDLSISKRDDQKTASELQAESTMDHPSTLVSLDVAAVALYNEAIPPTIQAVLAEAGPAFCQQQHGRIVTKLPPVANWSKGCSLQAGPKVGIPLTVHGTALELQRLANSVQFAATASTARILGNASPKSTRLALPFPPVPGNTEATPRVGLMQPAVGNQHYLLEDDWPVLYVTGHCSVHHTLSEYLLKQTNETEDIHLNFFTKNWTVAWTEQEFVTIAVLPFFLALAPPTVAPHVLQSDSLKHLYALYVTDLGPHLIHMLACMVRTGGARVHEEILQNGILHILSSSLRLGLIRATKLKLFKDKPKLDDFLRRAQTMEDLNSVKTPTSNTANPSPSFIPPGITFALVDLLDACCGPDASFLEEMSPAMQIRRTSDLALSMLFGLALDFDLWACDLKAALVMWKAVVAKYGGVCVTTGYVLRSQVSVQHFLDRVRLLRYENEGDSLETVATLLSQLLQSMLLSSLSNQRSITQGEKDVSACVAALSDCYFGSLTAHVVLSALVGVLAWCEILPIEAAAVPMEPCVNEEHKIDVASRMGRNLLMGQFHDAIAPVILSRTVFSGDNVSCTPYKATQTSSGPLSWQHHWRLSMLLFSWIASIGGPEGLIASKSTGSLVLASALAGSLDGALLGSDKVVTSTMFMPSPAIALLIGASLRNDWSYKDLLADRLQIMMPLLPGMIVSLLSHPRDFNSDDHLSKNAAIVLSDILTAVGGAFHRVFGGSVHTSGQRQAINTRSSGSSEAIKAAKTYVPHLLVVSMIIENHIVLRRKDSSCEHVVEILRSSSADDAVALKRQTSSNSWSDVATMRTDDLVGDMVLSIPSELDDSGLDAESLVSFLISCQKSVLGTACGLLSNAVTLGGAGAALPLLKKVLTTLEESEVYAFSEDSGESRPVMVSDSTNQSDGSVHDDSKIEDTPSLATNSKASILSRNVLCRVIALIITKSQKREQQWDVWDFELSAAISRLCVLVEEKDLLLSSFSPSEHQYFSDDQIVLICSLTEILSYGRECSGWCQLSLPKMGNRDVNSRGDMNSNSVLLLPVLRPCLRIILNALRNINTSTKVIIPNSQFEEQILLDWILEELDKTLTAAIVGLSFSSARDTALRAMTSLRTYIGMHSEVNDEGVIDRCRTLLVKLAEELRVRYESERRLRNTALFDAYDEDGNGDSAKEAAQGSLAVERLILGAVGMGETVERHEEVTFENPKKTTSDDFVLFHEPDSGNEGSAGKLGFQLLQGLGAALEESKQNLDQQEESDTYKSTLATLAPFLDAWEAADMDDKKDTDLVKLFETKVDVAVGSENKETPVKQLPILGSETAADAMSTFFEFAAIEKSRIKEISVRFLPGQRYSKISFAERFCWARLTELLPAVENFWERSMSDGNRDVRSRIPTIPCCPQFNRYLPKYLDHGSERSESMRQKDDYICEKSENDSSFRDLSAIEFDNFTKTLVETGNLEIVDITKKENDEGDDVPEPLHASSAELLDEEEEALFATDSLDDDKNRDNKSAPSGEKNLDADSISEELNIAETLSQDDEASFGADQAGKGYHGITTSSFSTPPDNSSSSLSLMHSAAAGLIEQHVRNCVHVKAEGNRDCTLLLTSSHLILEYDGNQDGFFEGEVLAMQEEADRQKRIAEDAGDTLPDDPEILNRQRSDKRQRAAAALRPKSIRWNLSEVSHIYLRRFRLRDSALELFVIPTGGTSYGGYGMFSPASSLFLDFGSGHEGKTRRDEAAFAIMRRSPPQAIKQWPDRSDQFLHEQLSRLTIGWVEGRITNFDYLLHLNILAGRSYNDITQYPVFPWVLADYTSEEIPDLSDKGNFRDLSKPVGALNPQRLAEFLERFNTFADPSIPPFMYGSHYSTSAGVVLHFLVRLHPFAGLHRQLQGGHFDVADRLFSSVPRTWSMCTGTSAAEVKELTPEWYCNPSFLRNSNNFKLGTSQDGDVLGDVVLPPWAKDSPEKFVEVMRAALESEICSGMLSDWIDLIFGRKQQGPEAIKANNVFFYLTYYGTVDVASIEDEALRVATETQIAHFGQCPMQLFKRPHVRRLPRNYFNLSLYQVLSSYTQNHQDMSSNEPDTKPSTKSPSTDRARLHSIFGEPLFLPFLSAPMSHWVHSNAPPPGPHAPLVTLRFAGTDKILAIDAKGIFHSFRWAWRAEDIPKDSSQTDRFFDKGCFVAQRELPRFRTVPRLLHSPHNDEVVAVAISKTLFANRSVLLVLSDGDGYGSMGMQLVDPSKGEIKGEVCVPYIHSAKITAIATDPIGTAAGHGGVGGELALVGSADGTGSIWRFMSSHYLPMRPRVRLQGHNGRKVVAVALCSAIHVAATLSSNKCCIHSTGNGVMIRSFEPPDDSFIVQNSDDSKAVTEFADTSALAISVQGFVVTVCKTTIQSDSDQSRIVITLHLFTIEGKSLGSKPLESWRGLPSKMHCTPDGTAVMVCCGRGVTIHRLSACQPLEFLDEFQVTESDDFDSSSFAAWDVDLGPQLNRPVVAAAACSEGALRLHALPGISSWSERHKKGGLTQTMGAALGNPARKLKSAMKDSLGFSKLAGIGRDLQREVASDVKERGVGGFLGNVMSFRKNNTQN